MIEVLKSSLSKLGVLLDLHLNWNTLQIRGLFLSRHSSILESNGL